MQPLVFRTHFNDFLFFENNFDFLQEVNYILLTSRALVNHDCITHLPWKLLYNPGEMEILVGFMIDLQKSYMDWGPRECA